MTVPFRLIGRVLFLLLVLVLLATGGVLAWFTSWRADRVAALDAESEVAETASGPVEYVVAGEGPAVLIFHGAPGGWDQAALLGASLVGEGFRVVAPSRPGYLRTPLATGLLPGQQADAMAALLDVLEIADVAVVGFGEGAPAAIEFAARHRARTRGVLLESAVTSPFRAHDPGDAAEFGRGVLDKLTGDVGAWLAFRHAERDASGALAGWLPLTIQSPPATEQKVLNDATADPAKLEWFQEMVGSFVPLSSRETGTRNDLIFVRTLTDLPLEKVTAPALVIHGELDRCAPISLARKAAARLKNGHLFEVPPAGRWLALSPESAAVDARRLEFLRSLPPPAEPPANH